MSRMMVLETELMILPLVSVQLIKRKPGFDNPRIVTLVFSSYLPDVIAAPPLVGTATKRKLKVSGGGGCGLKCAVSDASWFITQTSFAE